MVEVFSQKAILGHSHCPGDGLAVSPPPRLHILKPPLPDDLLPNPYFMAWGIKNGEKNQKCWRKERGSTPT